MDPPSAHGVVGANATIVTLPAVFAGKPLCEMEPVNRRHALF
jgi:hypothetical protein